MLKLTPDFKEFLKLLNSAKIEYRLIGGYAVAHYGVVRPTKDMDVWVAISPSNLAGLTQVLIDFGFSAESLPAPLFKGTKTVLRMGMPPNRLEILSEISGVQFDECYTRRQLELLDEVPVTVISFEDLKANKLASGRPQDLSDVQKLEKRRKP